jgi:large subunit ribosomal protein L6
MSDLFFFKQDYCSLTLYFFLKKNKSELDSIATQCTLLSSAFVGVSKRYSLALWLKGVGFKFRLVPGSLVSRVRLRLSLGFSHPLKIVIPAGCTVSLVGKKKLFFTGICFQGLTQLLSYLQSFKPPDPYKGKGLNYKYKVKVLKPGKKS